MRRRLREAILWIGAALGMFCLVWTGVMFAFGLTPLVFTSGSMEPAIDAGDLAFATTVPAEDLERGDIVSVINDRGTRITHRVTKVDRQDDGDAILQLKGDANQSPDQQAYRVSEVERVGFSVPKAGYLVNVAGSPNGMFVGGLVVAGLLYLGFRRPGGDRGGDEDEGGTHGPARRAVMVSAVLVSVGLVSTSSSTQPTTAAFSDSPAMTTGGLGAGALPARPSSISCSKPFLSLSANVTWSDDNARHGYYYEIDDNADFSSPELQETVAPTGSNSFTFSSGSVGGWFSSYTWHFRVYSALIGPDGIQQTWRSSSYRAYRVTRSAFFNDFTCAAVISPAN